MDREQHRGLQASFINRPVDIYHRNLYKISRRSLYRSVDGDALRRRPYNFIGTVYIGKKPDTPEKCAGFFVLESLFFCPVDKCLYPFVSRKVVVYVSLGHLLADAKLL